MSYRVFATNSTLFSKVNLGLYSKLSKHDFGFLKLTTTIFGSVLKLLAKDFWRRRWVVLNFTTSSNRPWPCLGKLTDANMFAFSIFDFEQEQDSTHFDPA